jgi:four helix bundle protein
MRKFENLKMESKDNVIIKLTFKFAIDIIKYCEILQENKKFVIANQLLKSGTSIGANIREAQNAESKADFIHKFKISAKEIEETIYWLDLCEFSENYPSVEELIEQVNAISRIVNKIIITSKQK